MFFNIFLKGANIQCSAGTILRNMFERFDNRTDYSNLYFVNHLPIEQGYCYPTFNRKIIYKKMMDGDNVIIRTINWFSMKVLLFCVFVVLDISF